MDSLTSIFRETKEKWYTVANMDDAFLSESSSNTPKVKILKEKIEELRKIREVSPPDPDDKQFYPHFIDLCQGVLSYVDSLEQDLFDIRIVLNTTLQHSTELENDLENRNQYLSNMWERYESIVNSSTEWMCLINKSYKLEAANDAFCQGVGQRREDILGKSLDGIWGKAYFRKRIKPDLDRALNGEVVSSEIVTMDSEQLPVDLIATYYPFENTSNKVAQVAINFRDVTVRKRAEKTIKEQNAFLNQVHDAIYVLDMDCNITFWNQNAATLYGIGVDDAVGQKSTQILYEGRLKESLAAVLDAVQDQGEWRGEWHFVKDGQDIVIDSRWTLLRDNEQSAMYIMVADRDITDKKQLESQFYRAQRMESIGSLASGIAHDLNNVLSHFFLSIRALKTKLTDNHSDHILSMLESSTHRGVGLVRQILTFARGLSDKFEEVHVDDVLDDVKNFVSDTFPKEISFDVTTPKTLWPIIGNKTQVYQILMNLCVNARDAMPDGGLLSIVVKKKKLNKKDVRNWEGVLPGAFVHFEISDEGTGMDAETLAKIFEPFFTTKEVGKGTGLGLSTVMSIVKNHGGAMTVDSTPGKGTKFSVFLPAAT